MDKGTLFYIQKPTKTIIEKYNLAVDMGAAGSKRNIYINEVIIPSYIFGYTCIYLGENVKSSRLYPLYDRSIKGYDSTLVVLLDKKIVKNKNNIERYVGLKYILPTFLLKNVGYLCDIREFTLINSSLINSVFELKDYLGIQDLNLNELDWLEAISILQKNKVHDKVVSPEVELDRSLRLAFTSKFDEKVVLPRMRSVAQYVCACFNIWTYSYIKNRLTYKEGKNYFVCSCGAEYEIDNTTSQLIFKRVSKTEKNKTIEYIIKANL
jgi:hypothetical protein